MGARHGLARRLIAGSSAAALVALLILAIFSGALFTHRAAATLQYTPPPLNTAPPAISGTAVVGQTLTGDRGTWVGATTFAYSWLRCAATCKFVAGANKQTYKLAVADLGARLHFTVKATNKGGSRTVTSGPTAVVLQAPSVKTVPKVTGALVVGHDLTVSDGTWAGSQPMEFTYAWLRCAANGKSCSAIGGATTSAYTLVGSDLDHRIRADVTATNTVDSATASSAVTPAVKAVPANSDLPTISGTAKKGKVLKASPGTWAGSPPIVFVYQWERCDADGNACTPLNSRATTYALKAADVGSTMRVIVGGKNSAGSATATSPHSPVVVA